MQKIDTRLKQKVKIEWSPNFAYAIGLIASDGYVSKDKRHVSFVSKDEEQIVNYMKALSIRNKIGYTRVKNRNPEEYRRVQFSDAVFWRFLNEIGLYPAKSKIIGELLIPDQFFFDFLRGEFDGDGSISSYYDKRWKSSFLFYISFATASKDFALWLRGKIELLLGIHGHISISKRSGFCQLRYAKTEAILLISKMYENPDCIFLSRKRLKINGILCSMSDNARVAKLVTALP
jgi:LAGLIDADG-like domain